MKKVCATKQDYLDLLWRCAVDGTFPSMRIVDGSGKECLYRGHGKQRCAVGILLPDELYHPSLEGKSISSLGPVVVEKVRPEGMSESSLNQVQGVHDREAFKEVWDSARFRQGLLDLECFKGMTPRTPG